MAPPYKVTYFHLSGLGEPIRYLLSYGLEFEDNRIKIEDWEKLKSKMPFGQMPILEHNGKVAHQSIAISRYLGRILKLNGNDAWEDLEIDSMADTINDFRGKVTQYYYCKDEKRQAILEAPLFKEIIPFYLTRLEAIAKENNGHLALKRLTWVDFFFTALMDYLSSYLIKNDILKGYVHLTKVRDTIQAFPKIKSYLEKRPEDDENFVKLFKLP